MNIEIYEENIKKTGFLLEFRISETLRKAKWSVINNKYYIDDQSGVVREIDIVAYKVKKIQSFHVFTTLIISCKKNENNLWALLSKNIDKNDKNMDWKPIHIWTNNKVLNHLTSDKSWKNNYYDYISQYGVKKALCIPETHIFAFQEMGIKDGKVHNDSSIFNSVTSLMKAQAFELASLPERKKMNCIYQFNLLSVIGSELIKLQFEEDQINGCEIEQEHYITRYIISKEETFARIHFVKESAFANVLDDYDLYHEANLQFFDEFHNIFYHDAVKNWKKIDLLKEDFLQALRWNYYPKANAHQYRFSFLNLISSNEIYFYWDSKEEVLLLQINLEDEEISTNDLNGRSDIKDAIKKGLRDIYRFQGEFRFTDFDFDDIPF